MFWVKTAENISRWILWEHIYDISLGIISCLILTGFGLTVFNTLHMFCVSNRTAVYKTFCKLFYFCQISTLKRSQWAYVLPLLWYAYPKIAKHISVELRELVPTYKRYQVCSLKCCVCWLVIRAWKNGENGLWCIVIVIEPLNMLFSHISNECILQKTCHILQCTKPNLKRRK